MRILIVFYGGGHVAMAIPVIEELKRRGHTVVPLALTVAGEVMRRRGLAHRRPIDYVAPETVRCWGEPLLSRHHTEGKGLSVSESLAYLGVSYRDLVDEVGEEEAARRYATQGLNAFCPVAFMTEVLLRERPDLVVATPSPRMEQAALRASYALGVPSVCMVDLWALLELPWLRRPDNGDFLTVYSDKIRRRLVAAGRPAERIFITGNPAFDALAEPANAANGKALRQARGVADHERLILWAEQPEPGDPDLPRRIRAHLHAICSARPGWRLMVRLHPASSDPAQETIPQGALQSHAEESLAVALYAADAVVTLTSTVGMEALLCDRPLLVMRLSQYSDLVDFSAEDGALVIDRLGDAENGLRSMFDGGESAARLASLRRTLPGIGSAAVRVCDVLEYPAVRERRLCP